MAGKKTVGIVGARGHTGAELVRLLSAHPGFELAFVSSRELDGQPVSAHVPEYRGALRYANIPHEALGGFGVDACVLALPNDADNHATLEAWVLDGAPGPSAAAEDILKKPQITAMTTMDPVAVIAAWLIFIT